MEIDICWSFQRYTDHIRCQELHDEQERLNKKLDALYEEWSELSDI